jgi:hypothetical protein
MISVGGWDAPHPDTANRTAEDVYRAWRDWNLESARVDGWRGFDGIDWDLEGNDDAGSPYNLFTPECLTLVGRMSQLARAEGFLVSLVPVQVGGGRTHVRP